MAAKFSSCKVLAAQPRPMYHVRPPRVEFMCCKKTGLYGLLPTAQDTFWPIPGFGCNSTSGGTWYKENGELKQHAHSCKKTASCDP